MSKDNNALPSEVTEAREDAEGLSKDEITKPVVAMFSEKQDYSMPEGYSFEVGV